MSKIPVQVYVEIDVDGLPKPKSLFYEDEEYPIDRILNIKPLNSLKSGGGGNGYWYKCAVSGRVVFLVYDGVTHKWQMDLSAA